MAGASPYRPHRAAGADRQSLGHSLALGHRWGGHNALSAMHRLTRQGDPGSLGPIILVTRSFAPLKFSAVLGFYDMAWVTPAIIYVWSMFGENLLGAGSGVNTEQPPHKNCFPQEFKGACPNIVRLSCPTTSARVESWGSAK